jgi:hypothetical protein
LPAEATNLSQVEGAWTRPATLRFGRRPVVGRVHFDTAIQVHRPHAEAVIAKRLKRQRPERRLGLPLATIYEDAGLSGSLSLEDRPGLLEAVAAVGRGDTLLVAKRDRLGRDGCRWR